MSTFYWDSKQARIKLSLSITSVPAVEHVTGASLTTAAKCLEYLFVHNKTVINKSRFFSWPYLSW